jgi:recombination protein RecA
MSDADRLRALQEKLSAINKSYGTNTFQIASERKFQKIPRIPTGIFGLDYALGGGLPIGRISLFCGDRSSSKTTTALRILGNAQKLCFNCYKWKEECKCGEKMRGGVAALIEPEGVFDAEWAAAVGVDLKMLPMSQPEYSEQVVDIGEQLIRSKTVDIIMLDSIAAMCPSEELEKSSEEWQQGLAARINNKCWRKWQSAMNEVYRETDVPTTIILINQMRLKIGVMYGDPNVKPGGKGQDFVTSVEVKMSAGKYEFEEAKEKEVAPNTVSLRYKVEKNKTGPAKIEGEYEMAVRDFGEYKKGDVVEEKYVLKKAEDLGMLVKESATKWAMLGVQTKTKGELINHWVKDTTNFRILKSKVLDLMLGNTV